MKKYLLGIDQGTSAIKVVLFDFNGTPLAAETVSYKVEYPEASFAEQNPDDWYAAACVAIKRITSAFPASYIAAAGVDGIGWSPVFIDENGNTLIKTPIWLDTRANNECIEISSVINEDDLFNLCGNPLTPNYGTPKILWVKKNNPKAYEKTYKILQSNSFLVYKLTNALTQDKSQSYAYHFYDMRACNYNKAYIKKLGLEPEMFPLPIDCDSIAGAVTEKAARETGLRAGIPVIAGGLDAACATLGAGVINPGQTQEQGGQAGGMSICLSSFSANKGLILGNHAVPGRWLLQGGTTGGGGTMKWFREQLGSNMSFDELTSGIVLEPDKNGIVFLPYMQGERSPVWDPKAKGVFYGLSYSSTQKDLIRAIMEGVAFSLRHNLETAYASGAKVGGLHATGGSAKSAVWAQIKADVSGLPVSIPSSQEGTALGAALLAGKAAGIYKNYDEAVFKTIKIIKTYYPNKANTKTYDNLYVKYLELYKRLSPVWKEEF